MSITYFNKSRKICVWEDADNLPQIGSKESLCLYVVKGIAIFTVVMAHSTYMQFGMAAFGVIAHLLKIDGVE